ncbi:MAG: CHAD domain-containing protein [Actinomycetota bacterium]|nr:CHAD domain-containing protein [Actinomycetota bacterium]
MRPPTTFVFPLERWDEVVDALGGIGFAFGPAEVVARTVLDTFDGRLHKAGVRLDAIGVGPFRLVVVGENLRLGVGPGFGDVEVASLPTFAADVPDGELGRCLHAVIEPRRLLPLVQVAVEQTTGTWKDRSGLTVGIVTLGRHLVVGGRPVGQPAGIVEVHTVPGCRKRARRVEQAIAGRGLAGAPGDTVVVAAEAAGIDLAGFSAPPTVALDPMMHTLDGFRAVLSNMAEVIEANWQGTVEHLDPEFLHVLRVAVRRTRAVLAHGKNVLPPTVTERAREGFAWLGAISGPARDLDVHLLDWDRYTSPLGSAAVSSLEPVRALLQQRQAEAHAALAEGMQSAQARELLEFWRAWLHPRPRARRPPPGPQAERLLGAFVVRRIERAQDTLLERGRLIHPDTPAAQVHDLRKDAKRLRYLLECFGGLLPPAPRKRFVQRLKALQDNLGRHQDAEVYVGELRALAHALPPATSADTLVALGRLIERLDASRVAARAEFAQRFAAYDTQGTQRALELALALPAR